MSSWVTEEEAAQGSKTAGRQETQKREQIEVVCQAKEDAKDPKIITIPGRRERLEHDRGSIRDLARVGNSAKVPKTGARVDHRRRAAGVNHDWQSRAKWCESVDGSGT
jgi:hypothetical protein